MKNGRNRAERLEMVRRFEESGLTRKAFSQQDGVGLSTLNYWLGRERRRALVPAGAGGMVFGELKLGSPTSEESGWAMEVVSPAGLRVRSREALPGELLIRLLRARGC